ncbi:MAG: YbbR-like domain-containing protein [Candidatus Marinimicrobia bacterium]|nr:YbbR-like domain-containing protein [Candidatus Neomarinimicrobiota bacterium]
MRRGLTEKKPFYTDLVYKLGAVGLAIILWFVSISNSHFEADVSLPIEIRNIRVGKALGEEAPRTAVLRFRGNGRTLVKLFLLLPFTGPKLVLDLERVQRRHVFYLDEYIKDSPQRISIPIVGMQENLDFVEVVSPDSVAILLGDYVEQTVPVQAQVTILPAAGYTQVGDLLISPESVTVKGVVEEVNKINYIRSMRRTYSDVNAPLDISVGLLHPDPGKVLDVSPVNVTVQADIQMVGERRLMEVPVKMLNVPADLVVYVSPSTVSLTVIGGVDFLADQDNELVNISIDFATQWSPTNHFVEPQIVMDENIIEFRDLVPKQLELITTRISP